MFQNNSLCFVVVGVCERKCVWLVLWFTIVLEWKLSQLENFGVCGWKTTTTKTAEYIAVLCYAMPCHMLLLHRFLPFFKYRELLSLVLVVWFAMLLLGLLLGFSILSLFRCCSKYLSKYEIFGCILWF